MADSGVPSHLNDSESGPATSRLMLGAAAAALQAVISVLEVYSHASAPGHLSVHAAQTARSTRDSSSPMRKNMVAANIHVSDAL